MIERLIDEEMKGRRFKELILENDMKVICYGCKVPLYVYSGDFNGTIKSKDFKPTDSIIPAPTDGQLMKCPLCGFRIFDDLP